MRRLIVTIALLVLAGVVPIIAQDEDTAVPPPPEPTGDVYDDYMTQTLPVSDLAARRADMVYVAATAGTSEGAQGGFMLVPPSGGQYAVSAMIDLGDAHAPFRAMSSDVPIVGSGSAIFVSDDSALTVDGETWRVFFRADRVDVTLTASSTCAFQERPGAEDVTLHVQAGDAFTADLSGVNAAVEYNAVANTLKTVLTEGRAAFTLPVTQTFDAPDDGENALVLLMDAFGNTDPREVPLADAGMNFAPVFRTLSFHIAMRVPIAKSKDEAEQKWMLMLNLDGNPATGLNYIEGTTNPMYGGLGADFIAPMSLQDEGEVVGLGVFPEAPGTDIIPVMATLSANRRTLTIDIPLALLYAQAEAAGISFTLDTLCWRVASIYYNGDADPKDIYPELDYVYPAPPEIPPTPTPTMPPASPTPTEATEPTEDDPCLAVTNANVNLRAGPGTGFARVGGLDINTEVRIIGVNVAEDWYRVALDDGGETWIAAPLLDNLRCSDDLADPIPDATPTATQPAAPHETPSATPDAVDDACQATTAANVNLRAGPGTEFRRLGVVDAGTELQIVGVNPAGDWYLVQSADITEGEDAWVAEFLLEYFYCPDASDLKVIE